MKVSFENGQKAHGKSLEEVASSSNEFKAASQAVATMDMTATPRRLPPPERRSLYVAGD
jgi:DNA-binding XRE family transcriptional regulator